VASSWVSGKTSADYAPAVLLFPNGATRQGGAYIPRIDTLDAARAKLALGLTAVVRKEDAGRVRNGAVD